MKTIEDKNTNFKLP